MKKLKSCSLKRRTFLEHKKNKLDNLSLAGNAKIILEKLCYEKPSLEETRAANLKRYKSDMYRAILFGKNTGKSRIYSLLKEDYDNNQ